MKTSLLIVLLAIAAAAAHAAPRFTVDPAHSRIDVVVKATMDSFTGELTKFEPAVTYDPATGQVEGAELTFAFTDLKTGKAERDRQMHEWQETEKYPNAHYRLSRLEPLQPGHFTAHGTLQLHGVTRELAFPVALASDGSNLVIDGEAVIDTRDFGLKVIRKFALLKVNPLVTIRFHLQGPLDSTADAAATP